LKSLAANASGTKSEAFCEQFLPQLWRRSLL
jgi:hypothetical protein